MITLESKDLPLIKSPPTKNFKVADSSFIFQVEKYKSPHNQGG